MTRDKALKIANLIYQIETYEDLIDEISSLKTTDEIVMAYGINIEEELVAVVQPKLDALLKELEEM